MSQNVEIKSVPAGIAVRLNGKGHISAELTDRLPDGIVITTYDGAKSTILTTVEDLRLWYMTVERVLLANHRVPIDIDDAKAQVAWLQDMIEQAEAGGNPFQGLGKCL